MTILRGWDTYKHGNCRVSFISSFDGQLDYMVSGPSHPQGIRVRCTREEGLDNGWNNDIPQIYKEAVEAFRTELESQYTEKARSSQPA